MFSGCALYLLPGRDMSQQRRKVLKGIVTSNGGTVCEEISTATSLGLNEAAKRSCEPQYCLVLRLNEWCERERECGITHKSSTHRVRLTDNFFLLAICACSDMFLFLLQFRHVIIGAGVPETTWCKFPVEVRILQAEWLSASSFFLGF